MLLFSTGGVEDGPILRNSSQKQIQLTVNICGLYSPRR